ncbi:hypothetical protein [Streptomyces sp. NPDC018584]|uniref:hypothetical protein n=1 Tax=unclassified Streptomyces TaxID=2593676 RepID=UPI0037990B9B
MQDLMNGPNRALHPVDNVHQVRPNASIQPDEALARSVTADIGPRKPGVVYYDGPRLVEVLQVITDRSEARRILKRRAAQFAVIVRDLHTGAEHPTCTVWTGTDRALKAVAA